MASADDVPRTALAWIGDGRPDPQGAQFYADDPAPEFRAAFTVPSAAGATVRVACAGYFDLAVNGRPLGDPAAPKPLWETWRESGGVYSNCHPMLGSVDEWLLRYGRAR